MKCLGFLILLTSLSLVSGLCSTCLEERCYDNGECVIGCVPGYVGQYCDEDCPSRCLNKACHVHIDSGAITCTDGCEPGYCDIKCEVECPGECATCDRQCRSCNVTLCPERRYGADCGEKCTGRYGKCDSETGQCIRCTRGYYGDECDQMCPGCFTLADNLYDTCLSGCDICQTEGTCKVGFYGDSCELKCSTGCKNPGGCNRATGECDGCVSGYHGLTCNYTCSSLCEGWVCNQSDGVCTSGCISGYKTNLDMCEKYDNEDICKVGFYGDSCKLKCSTGCKNQGGCNRATGECSDGCVSGYHGLICNNMCSSFCVGGVCNQHDGVCTFGCISGYKTNLDMCEKYDNEDICKVGFYGDSCKLKCSTGCKNQGGCNRATGECSDGCVSGYHGLICDNMCSSFCVGGVCNQHDGVCTFGCISGYKTNLDMCEKYDNEDICKVGFYGDSCKLKCPTGCKNQGGCNRATGECSDGCVSGYHGLICNNMCSSFCVGGVCNQHDGVCTFGCISGYKTNLDMCEKYDNEDICKVGFYGDSCKLKCPTGCKNQGGCNRATGECSDGCVSGYHGLICNNMCSSFCVGGVCNQHDGVCTFGCISGYKTNLDMCEKYDNEGFNTTVAIAVLIIVLICLVVGMVTAVVIWRRHRSRRWTNQLK